MSSPVLWGHNPVNDGRSDFAQSLSARHAVVEKRATPRSPQLPTKPPSEEGTA